MVALEASLVLVLVLVLVAVAVALALVAVALVAALLGDLPAATAMQRLLWLGIAPASVALGLGAALRRWLPRHLLVYILGRGFFATLLADTAAGFAHAALYGAPAGLSAADWLLARWLVAWGDAIVTGMLVAVFVAFRPQWLATYADRLYLPPAPPPAPPAA